MALQSTATISFGGSYKDKFYTNIMKYQQEIN